MLLFQWLRALVDTPSGAAERDADDFGPSSGSNGSSSSESSVHMGYVSSPWRMTPGEQGRLVAIRILLGRCRLPPELISNLLRYACEGRTLTATRIHADMFMRDANDVYLRTLPLKSRLLRHFVYRIDIHIESHDQGWSSDQNTHWHGTTEGSWTWWDLALIRPLPPDGEVEVQRIEVQRNLHAVKEFQNFDIQLGPDCPIAYNALPGDRFALFARSMYPGWTNFVRQAHICVTIDSDA